MSAEHREPSRTYVRLTPPPRVLPPGDNHKRPAREGRVLTPLGGLVVATVLGLMFWAGAIGFLVKVLR